jgi:hypothetical protein
LTGCRYTDRQKNNKDIPGKKDGVSVFSPSFCNFVTTQIGRYSRQIDNNIRRSLWTDLFFKRICTVEYDNPNKNVQYKMIIQKRAPSWWCRLPVQRH